MLEKKTTKDAAEGLKEQKQRNNLVHLVLLLLNFILYIMRWGI